MNLNLKSIIISIKPILGIGGYYKSTKYGLKITIIIPFIVLKFYYIKTDHEQI